MVGPGRRCSLRGAQRPVRVAPRCRGATATGDQRRDVFRGGVPEGDLDGGAAGAGRLGLPGSGLAGDDRIGHRDSEELLHRPDLALNNGTTPWRAARLRQPPSTSSIT